MSQKSPDSPSPSPEGVETDQMKVVNTSPHDSDRANFVNITKERKASENSVLPKRPVKSKEKTPEVTRVDPNCRERWRQQHVNVAFLRLRRILPSYPVDKKLSKQEILRRTIKYIRLLEGVLKYFDEQDANAEAHFPQAGNADSSDENNSKAGKPVAEPGVSSLSRDASIMNSGIKTEAIETDKSEETMDTNTDEEDEDDEEDASDVSADIDTE